MTKPSSQLDYAFLEQQAKPQYKFAEVQGKIRRIAFDVFKFNDGSSDDLWKVESTADGDYLVALYPGQESESIQVKQASRHNNWEVHSKDNEVHVFYQGAPIHKFTHSEADLIARTLPNKLASDAQFRKALLKELPTARQTEIIKLYPELA